MNPEGSGARVPADTRPQARWASDGKEGRRQRVAVSSLSHPGPGKSIPDSYFAKRHL